MTIAVFSDTFFPSVNGIVTHLSDTLPLLAKKHKIILFVPKPAKKIDDLPEFENIEIVYLPSFPTMIYKDLRVTWPFTNVVTKKIEEIKPDIIHIHSPSTVGLSGLLAAKKSKIPIISTFHGYFAEPEYLRIVHLDKLPLISRIIWMAMKQFYNNTDRIISPTGAVREDVEKRGITKPVDVISNGINLDDFTKEHTKQFNIPIPYFLYVGRLSREKNLDILLKSFAEVKSETAKLVIVGAGPILDDLKKLTIKLLIIEKVQFLGEIPRNKLIQSNVLYDALAFITASTSETQGISILEAMAAGLPIIGVRAKATPDLIENNGILCEPNDVLSLTSAMKNLLENPKKVETFKKNSFSAAREHSITKTIEKLEAVYKRAKEN